MEFIVVVLIPFAALVSAIACAHAHDERIADLKRRLDVIEKSRPSSTSSGLQSVISLPAAGVPSQPVLTRAKTIMTGLWYPAILGTSLVFLIDYVVWGIRTEPAPAFSKSVAWLAGFQVAYFSLLYSEAINYHKYSWSTLGADLVDIFVMYAGIACLGLAGAGSVKPNWSYYYYVLCIGFAEPYLWRRASKWENIGRLTGRDWIPTRLDWLCLAALFGAFSMAVHHAGSPERDHWDHRAAEGAWIFVLIYGVAILKRANDGQLPGARKKD